MLDRLLPRDELFFDLFDQLAGHLTMTARMLTDLFAEPQRVSEHVRKIKEVEHKADVLTAGINQRINKSFVTPIDREDIHALISGLDDILDDIEEAADMFVLYRIEAPTSTAVQQAAIIVKQVEQLHDALGSLEGFKELDRYWIEVHRLENEGDQLVRSAIADLFLQVESPIDVIKWKDIYGILESTIDKAEDVANIIERITIKHA